MKSIRFIKSFNIEPSLLRNNIYKIKDKILDNAKSNIVG